MVIELRGVEFHNKGAELMLHAILNSIRERFPDALFVMEKRPGPATSIKKQRSLGIYTKLNIKKYGIDSAKWGLLIPTGIRRKIGFIHEKEINVVLDGSGFAFGDFWGPKKAGERLADNIVQWKKQGKKIVMLPQAFGSFENPLLRNKMRLITDHADLIFARDKYSYDYLRELNADTDRIMLKPDFTNLIKGKAPDYFDVRQAEVAIIPNNKLLESSIFESRDQYLDVLNRIAELVEQAGKIPYFLIHEGKKDEQLAEEVNQRFGKSIKVVKEENPLSVKGIIGKSHSVITSRFHGLVSSLSQGIPCLCIGWSHKYKALMEDYNFSDGIITEEDLLTENLKAKIDLITHERSAAQCREVLIKASEKEKKRAKEMWDEVFNLLES